MTIIIWIISVIAIIIGLFLLIALFIRKEYAIEKDIIISRPLSDVFAYVRLIKNQDQYNKWWQLDMNSKREYTGTDGQVGFIAAWNSTNNQAGEGAQEITSIKEGESIDCEIRFVRPFAGVSQTTMTTTPLDAQHTKVKWTFNGSSKYPMNAMFAMLKLDQVLGKDLALSLENLKKKLEN
ncbi:MAG: SRPBCC family protein [Cyclobacteriaceae bacterium]|nr:SRPBCC family protein [Cyclobacteriaceae bacterium]